MNKWQIAKVGIDLAQAYEWRAESSTGREVEGYFDAADDIRARVIILTKLSIQELLEKPPDDSDLSYPLGYPLSASLEEQGKWFYRQYWKFKDCGFCAELPDEITVDAEQQPEEIPPEIKEQEAAETNKLLTLDSTAKNVSDKPEDAAAVVNKRQLIKIGESLAQGFESEAAQYNHKDDRNFWSLEDAKNIKIKVAELLGSMSEAEIAEQQKYSDAGFAKEYLQLTSLAERYRWFSSQCENGERCGFCGLLPDDLTVTTGLEERFPDAFYKLTRFKEPEYVNEFNESDFRRCPKCATYYHWINKPEMYGTGNNDSEQLRRLSPRVSHLLDQIFSPAEEEKLDAPINTDDYFDDFPIDILVKALKIRAATESKILPIFVPALVRYLAKHERERAVSSLLYDYVLNKPEHANEVFKALRSMSSMEYSALTYLLLYCVTVVEYKK